MRGVMKVNWKKGLKALNVKDALSHSASEEGEVSDKNIDKKGKKKEGVGLFQTYANFLKGEEKEQYEKFLENRRLL